VITRRAFDMPDADETIYADVLRQALLR
jgi:hypothetical protein